MSSFLSKVNHNLPTGTAKQGLTGFAIDKGERYGASLAFGYAKGYYRERATFKGYGLDLWIGAGLTLLSGALEMWTGGRSKLAPHLERVGDAGVSSYLNAIGASMGANKAGRSVQVSPGKKDSVKGLYGTHVLGYIPQAMGGAYLDSSEIANFAARR